MLVSHHAALSALAALAAAPMVRDKKNLALFWAAAVGEDVDHYVWYALKHKNPSLRNAYRFFRARYGQPRETLGREDPRSLHGVAPLALVTLASLVSRRFVPIALGMAFHGLLDAVNENVIMAPAERRPGEYRAAPRREPTTERAAIGREEKAA